ncbi:MAG: glycosyltransferase family 2 protein [Desulfobacteraceae bacterium]|nr:glycosyltransferase family 2 protein [Desulfobacteraceae bacterium]
MIYSSPVFSIIIPAKNAGNFIHEALDSVLAQSFQDYEVLVIDDNSTDPTLEIVNTYLSKFKQGQLKIMSSPPDHIPGPGAVRNVGLRAARGEFVAFLDADDIWVPDHLENVRRSFENYPETVAYYGLAQGFDDSSRAWNRQLGWGPKEGNIGPFNAFQLIIQDDPAPLPSGCVRRKVAESVGGFEERLLTAQDWWFWICVAKQGLFVFSSKVEMLCRLHKNSHTVGGDGVNPMLSGPCFADVAAHSGVLTQDESRPLCNMVMDRTSRRLQHYVRTVQWDVLRKVLRIMKTCPSSERRIWFRIWIMVGKGLTRRLFRSAAVRLGLLPAERQVM